MEFSLSQQKKDAFASLLRDVPFETLCTDNYISDISFYPELMVELYNFKENLVTIESLLRHPAIRKAATDLGFSETSLEKHKLMKKIISNGLTLDFTLQIKLIGDNIIDTECGFNALHFAAQYGKPEIINIYLSIFPKTDIDRASLAGYTPLILATMNSITKVVELLINKGANPLICDNDGKRALDYAFAISDQNLINILVDGSEHYQYTSQMHGDSQYYEKEVVIDVDKPRNKTNELPKFDESNYTPELLEKQNEIFIAQQRVIELENKLKEKEEYIQHLEDQTQCIICMSNAINTVILDCVHAILCIKCTKELKTQECPMCSQKINRIITTKGAK